MAVREVLSKCRLFAGLSEQHLRLLLPLCREVELEEGAAVFREGDPARLLYILGRGKVALEMSVRRPDGSQARPTVVTSVSPGEAFGWSAVVEPHVMNLSAVAIEPCSMVCIDGQTLREVMEHHRDMGFDIMSRLAELLAQRLLQTRETLIYERGWALLI